MHTNTFLLLEGRRWWHLHVHTMSIEICTVPVHIQCKKQKHVTSQLSWSVFVCMLWQNAWHLTFRCAFSGKLTNSDGKLATSGIIWWMSCNRNFTPSYWIRGLLVNGGYSMEHTVNFQCQRKLLYPKMCCFWEELWKNFSIIMEFVLHPGGPFK